MERYLTLDLSNKEDALYFGNKFINDRPKWRKKIHDKQAELQAARELPAISNSEVHSGHISKPTENAAFATMKIEEQIKRYQDYETILTYGLDHIPEDEKLILTKLHNTRGKFTNVIIDELAIELDCDPRTIYRRKRQAILDFVDAIREIINY